jgi:hypothetical protein
MITKSDIDGIRKYKIKDSFLSMFLDDWVDLGYRGCFKFLESAINLSWAEAQRECEEIGGYLAEPRFYS